MRYLFSVFVLMLLLSCQKEELLLPDNLNNEVALKASVAFPDVLPLPNGFQPEGIAIGLQNQFYVGSLATGNIYKGDLRSGEGEVFINPAELGLAPGPAVGLALDKRSGYLYVAGGPTPIGIVYVYNYRTGALVQTFTYNSPTPVFLNDVIVTRDAVYFTDSLNPVLYKIPLTKNGRLQDGNNLEAVPLSGFSMGLIPDPLFPFPVFGNGIDAIPSGGMLILGNLNRGELYLVNPVTGVSQLIDLGGDELPYADGILLDGKTLYVAQNFLNQISVVELDKDFLSGSVVGVITDSNLNIPSTIAEAGAYLYAVNANFIEAPPTGEPFPLVEFEVVKIKK
ncbi:hypothetical protein LVD13_11200 [Flavobacteriaceae bacterium D16]|nr:hypothetical protein [Flavobacteriaceae bacterium D16]